MNIIEVKIIKEIKWFYDRPEIGIWGAVIRNCGTVKSETLCLTFNM